MLNWIKARYGDPEIIITENGWSDASGYLDDAMRIYFYKYYINNVMKGVCDFLVHFSHLLSSVW